MTDSPVVDQGVDPDELLEEHDPHPNACPLDNLGPERLHPTRQLPLDVHRQTSTIR